MWMGYVFVSVRVSVGARACLRVRGNMRIFAYVCGARVCMYSSFVRACVCAKGGFLGSLRSYSITKEFKVCVDTYAYMRLIAVLQEIFATDHTVYFSPDGTRIAFLRFNETAVPEYSFPLYGDVYPSEVIVLLLPQPGSRRGGIVGVEWSGVKGS